MCVDIILRNTPSVIVHLTQHDLRVDMPLFNCLAPPLQRLIVVLNDTMTIIGHL